MSTSSPGISEHNRLSDQDVSRGYLETAAEAGLLRHREGAAYVAGRFIDPISGERQCLVEYCDPCLLAAPPTIDEFARTLVTLFPEADSLVLRAPAAAKLPVPWERRLTFVRYVGGSAARPAEVVPETFEYESLTARWLRQALTNAYHSQGRTPDQAAVAATARQVMAAGDRRTYIAMSGSSPVGHVTMLSDRSDEVTGESIVELYDLLAESSADRGRVTGQLVDAAVAYVVDVGRPLIGNVVHRSVSKTDEPEHGLRVLDRLLARGWELDHAFWSARANYFAT